MNESPFSGDPFDAVSTVVAINDWQFLAGSGMVDGVQHAFIARLPRNGVAQAGVWKVDAGGLWSTPANWTLSVPDAPGATASFSAKITAPRTVTADRPMTVGRIEFDNPAGYTIAGSERITLRTPVGDAAIDVISGSHWISSPMTFSDNTVVTILPEAARLSIASAVDAGGMTLTKNGAGTLAIGQFRAAELLIDEGTVALLFGHEASVVGALAIAGAEDSPAARLDLASSAAVIDHEGTSPAAAVRQQILAGRGGAGFGATWEGNGIASSTVAAANAAEPESRSIGYADNAALPLGRYATFRGQPVDDTAVIIAYTRTGDANLDGVVNDDDVTIVGAFYAPGVPNPHWALGDFDYNGFVDDDDVTLLGVFYDPTATPIGTLPPDAPSTTAAVPEPTALALVIAAVLLLLVGTAARRPQNRGQGN